MNIYQRINEVRKEVAYIQKDKQVQTYKAVSHDLVVAMVRKHFVDNGIVVYPEQIRGLMNPAGQKSSKDGNSVVPDPMRLYEGGYRIHFVNIDEPTDRFAVEIEAHANDNGDKAPGKAVTYATKSALLKVLMLETGENDESRAPQAVEEPKTITPEQARELDAIIAQGIDKAGLLGYLNIGAIDEILAENFASVKTLLEERVKRVKAKARAAGASA